MTSSYIGIAIPAYKAHETLEATLRSCIGQTRKDWIAHVTVDGDGAEAEEAIVRRLDDPRIRLSWNGGALGQFGNFNRATLRCHAEGVRWIKFLCSDDLLRPDALERMVELGERSDTCGLVFGYYDGIDAAGRPVTQVDLSAVPSRIEPRTAFLRKAMRDFNPIGGPSSVMLRADALEHAGIFDDRLNYSGEAVLWYRVLQRYDVGIVGDRPILDYRHHENSVTGRGKLTTARFTNPIDIFREIAAHHAPLSSEWWLAQSIIGDVVVKNLGTCASIGLKGSWRPAIEGAAASLRRLTLPAVLPAAKATVELARRRLVGGAPSSSELSPPVNRVSQDET